MFTDDIGKYRKNSGRIKLSSDIGAYRKPPYGFTRCTDDIAPYRSVRHRAAKCTDDVAPFQGAVKWQFISMFFIWFRDIVSYFRHSHR